MYTFLVPALTSMLYAKLPSVTLYNPAIDLWKLSQYTNAVSCLIIFLVMMIDPPAFLRDGQKARYGQMSAFGFLAIAIQSYYSVTAQGTESEVMTEAAVSATIAVLVYNLGIAALTWTFVHH